MGGFWTRSILQAGDACRGQATSEEFASKLPTRSIAMNSSGNAHEAAPLVIDIDEEPRHHFFSSITNFLQNRRQSSATNANDGDAQDETADPEADEILMDEDMTELLQHLRLYRVQLPFCLVLACYFIYLHGNGIGLAIFGTSVIWDLDGRLRHQVALKVCIQLVCR